MRSGVGAVAALLLRGLAAAPTCDRTVVRDVAIVGGGAAGAHAAVWLRDHNQSVVVGGHTAFYRDPATNKTIKVGVQAWMEYKDTFDFPKRLNVSTNGSMEFTTLEYEYIDFAPPGPDALYPALQRYLDVILQYEDMVLPGFFKFPAPESIPEDLLMPFGEFVENNEISAGVPRIWDSTGQGLGDTMNVPTLFVIQASLLGAAAAAVWPSGRLFELYERIAELLGHDVLYSSNVISATRSGESVSLLVSDTERVQTCIEAKRRLIAFEPTAENMAPLATGIIPATDGELTFPAFANHGKMHPRVSAEVLRDGFIQKQLALQGRCSTWNTGAAFSAGFTTVLWEYNNVLLPEMIGDL